MVAEGCGGELAAIRVHPGVQHEKIAVREHAILQVDEAFYCVHGSVTMTTDTNQALLLHEGDVLIISKPGSGKTIAIASHQKTAATLIRATVRY